MMSLVLDSLSIGFSVYCCIACDGIGFSLFVSMSLPLLIYSELWLCSHVPWHFIHFLCFTELLEF